MEKEQITDCQCQDGDAEDALCPMEKEQITGCQCQDGDAEDTLSYGERADNRLSLSGW